MKTSIATSSTDIGYATEAAEAAAGAHPAPGARRSVRPDLFELQVRLVEQLKEQVYGFDRAADPELQRYMERYRHEVQKYQRFSSKNELLKAIRRAHLCYVGDFHALWQSQELVVRLLRELVGERPRIIIALEMLRAQDQEHAERYLDGEINEDAFLEAIDYRRTWGFPWAHYRPFFDFVREQRRLAASQLIAHGYASTASATSSATRPYTLGSDWYGHTHAPSRDTVTRIARQPISDRAPAPGPASSSSSRSSRRPRVVDPAAAGPNGNSPNHATGARKSREVLTVPDVRLVGLNCDAPEGSQGLAVRDAVAADLLSALTTTHPNHLIVVLYGDMHVASAHIPGEVQRRLATRDLKRRDVVVHQNSESIYWRLAEQRMEHRAEVLKLRGNRFCVMTASPIATFQSALDWQRQQDALADDDGDGDADEDLPVAAGVGLTESVANTAESLAQFFELDVPDVKGLSVYLSADPSWLDSSAIQRAYSPATRAILRELVPTQESGFLSAARVVYLARPSAHHAAEQATCFLKHCVTRKQRTLIADADPRSGDTRRRVANNAWPANRDEVYATTIAFALGFLGSKMIDHRRTCDKLPDYLAFLVANAGKRLSGGKARMRDLARLIVRHKELERRYHAAPMGSRRRFAMRTLDRLSPDVALAFSRALGYQLGDSLYRGLMDDQIKREEIRALFTEDHLLRPGLAQRRYLELVERTRHVRDKFKARAEQV